MLIKHENLTVNDIFIRFYYPQDMPQNWVSPHDYRNGTFYTRVEVADKTTTEEMALQWCLFQNGWGTESCQHDGAAIKIFNNGVYYQAMKFTDPGWWGAEALNWESGAWSNMQIVHKGPGGYYDGARKGMHFPYILVTWETVLVADGDELVLPDGLECQQEWGCGEPLIAASDAAAARTARSVRGRLTSGSLHIDTGFDGAYRVDVFDASGRRLQSFAARTPRCSFDLGTLGAGAYVAVVDSESEGRHSIRLVNTHLTRGQ